MKSFIPNTYQIFNTSIIFAIVLFLNFKCQGQSCLKLPTNFKSYSEANTQIKKSTFKLTENLPIGKSSWIIYANYYSCDGKYGYLFYTTNKGEYIHENVPYSVWKQFKTANSSET